MIRRRWILLALLVIPAGPAFAHLRIVATTTDLAALAQEIGKAQVAVSTLLSPERDPHAAAPVIPEALQLRGADLVIVVGLDYEGSWIGPLLKKYGQGRFSPDSGAYLDASAGCEILEKPEGDQANAGFSGVHPFGNPHYWLDPENGRRMARNFVTRFSELDPEHALEYQENLRKFEMALAAKEAEWQKLAETFRGASVVTHHASWANFAKAFNLSVVGTIEPWPGSPPDVDRAREVIGWIRDQRVSAVLVESYADPTMAQGIAAGADARVVILPTSVGAVPEASTYFDLLDYDLKLLQEALL